MFSFDDVIMSCVIGKELLSVFEMVLGPINAFELLNIRALKIVPNYEIQFFQRTGKIYRVKFQRVPLKFRTKYPTPTMKNQIVYNVKISKARRSKNL